MGSKKRNAAKNSSVQHTEKSPPSKSERTSNGLKQKRGGVDTKSKKSTQHSSGTRWVAIFLLSGVVAAVAVFYTSPEVQMAVNDLITRYTDPDQLGPVGSESIPEAADTVGKDTTDDKSQVTDDVKHRKSSDSADTDPGRSEGAKDGKTKDGKDSKSKDSKSTSGKTQGEQKRTDVKDQKKDAGKDGKDKKSPQKEKKESRKDNKSPQEDKKESQKDNKSPQEDKKESQKDNKSPQEDKKESQKEQGQIPEARKTEKPSHQSKGETHRDEGRKNVERTKDDSKEEEPARGSSKMERQKEEGVYEKSDITNAADNRIRTELDEIDDRLDQNLSEEALALYERVLDNHPNSPRALYGQAMALDKLSELRRSNEILELSLEAFDKVLHVEDVPDQLYKKSGRRLAERQQFRGYGLKASKTYEELTKKFPTDVSLMNELGVSYLMVGHNNEAKDVFKKVLKVHPRDGFAMVHLGFVLKISESNPVEAVPYLERGIQSGAEGTKDGRFYYHLGDALQRLGNKEKAYKYYSEAASLGLFLSAHQRSLYNVDYLQSHPWWSLMETGHSSELQNLRKHWREIRDEAVAQMNAESGLFQAEDENLREKGDWKQFTLFQQGRKNKRNCEKMPLTCSLIEMIPDASGCRRGQVKFSVMQPGVHVWPHCGPTNCRIRVHLGLIVPQGPRIRVVNETREWKEGDFIIFDDSFEHEVWHDGTEQRLVLIIDLWHPELTEDLKWSLTPI